MVLFLVLLLLLVAFIILKPKKARKSTNIKYEYQSKPRQREDNDEYKEYNKYNDKEVATPEIEIKYEIKKDADGEVYGEKDAYEVGSIAFEGGDEYRSSFDIEIDYKDREGLSTTRQVKVKSFRINEEETEAEIYGYCYLRDAGRTFYATRIKRCVDLDTGEIIKKIPTFLKTKHYASPEGKWELWMNKRNCEVEVLVYIGRLDKQLRRKEREIIIEYAQSKEPELNISIEVVEDYLKGCGTISKAMFGRHLTKLSAGTEDEKNDFIKTCEKIVGTKKEKTTEEQKAIENIRRRFFGKE